MNANTNAHGHRDPGILHKSRNVHTNTRRSFPHPAAHAQCLMCATGGAPSTNQKINNACRFERLCAMVVGQWQAGGNRLSTLIIMIEKLLTIALIFICAMRVSGLSSLPLIPILSVYYTPYHSYAYMYL